MKTAKYVFDKIATEENIRAAIEKAAENKSTRKEVKDVLDDIDWHVEKILDMLINKTYVPCECKTSIIREGSSQKEREVVKIDFFPDQIIHWAIILQLKPLIERRAYHYSCGSMPGKGAHYAKKKIERWLEADRKHTKYIAKLDITKYYASVKHSLAKSALRKIVKDPNFLWLMDLIIDSYPKGLPIGYLTSQWIANLILQPIDNFIKQVCGVKYYVRYMDDMVLFGNNKRRLHRIVRDIFCLLKEMGLKLKKNWQVFRLKCRPLDFMGFRFFGYKTTLRKSLMLRISRKARKIWKKGCAKFKDAAGVLSYLGWVKHSNTRGFFGKYVKKFVEIKELKNIARKYSRREIRRHENILLRKRYRPCAD